jgi:hypothetical protein
MLRAMVAVPANAVRAGAPVRTWRWRRHGALFPLAGFRILQTARRTALVNERLLLYVRFTGFACAIVFCCLDDADTALVLFSGFTLNSLSTTIYRALYHALLTRGSAYNAV